MGAFWFGVIQRGDQFNFFSGYQFITWDLWKGFQWIHESPKIIQINDICGNYLAVQWLRLCASTEESMGLVLGQGTKILYAAWQDQKIDKNLKNLVEKMKCVHVHLCPCAFFWKRVHTSHHILKSLLNMYLGCKNITKGFYKTLKWNGDWI